MSVFVRQRLRSLMSAKNQGDLIVVKELIEAGKLTPVIGARYPLSEFPKAIRHFEEGHARGKVVVTV